MRDRILNYLRVHPKTLNLFWKVLHAFFSTIAFFVPIRKKTMLITSFAGRKYDDSPKAIYDEVCARKEFDDWDLVWAFVDVQKYNIPRGRKVAIDTWSFFKALLYSKVWISNSGMDRNIDISRKGTVKVETWHGTPLKKIGSDQNSGNLGNYTPPNKIDMSTIRCAQSNFDRDIFMRVFMASKESFLLCDLPRNDSLLKYLPCEKLIIRNHLGIKDDKKIILYMPTYREYLVDENNQTYLAPPIDLEKWQEILGAEYVLLFRAHYAVNAALNLVDNDFVKNMSDYPSINDLYCVADFLISDYSSAYFDFAILDKPIFCFAYDLEEYAEKRGLYLNLEETLPCKIHKNEDDLLHDLLTIDINEACDRTRKFHAIYAPYAGSASKAVVDEIEKRLKIKDN